MERQRRRPFIAIGLIVFAVSCSLVVADAPQGAVTSAPRSWSTTVCRQVADGVAWQGAQALRHYRPPQSTYPPDVALLIVRTGVGGMQRHHCPPKIVGRALSRRLTQKQQEELFSHLPPGVVDYLRLGVDSA